MPARRTFLARSRLAAALATVLILASACGGSKGPAQSNSPTVAPSPSPVTANALVTGSWTMKITVVRNTTNNGLTAGQVLTRAWEFTPSCSDGPCDLHLSRENASGQAENEVTFEGGQYHFSTSSTAHCEDENGTLVEAKSMTDTTADFHVTAAELRDGILVATELEGTSLTVVTVAQDADCEPKHTETEYTIAGVPA